MGEGVGALPVVFLVRDERGGVAVLVRVDRGQSGFGRSGEVTLRRVHGACGGQVGGVPDEVEQVEAHELVGGIFVVVAVCAVFHWFVRWVLPWVVSWVRHCVGHWDAPGLLCRTALPVCGLIRIYGCWGLVLSETKKPG